jgi:hypothetical protein
MFTIVTPFAFAILRFSNQFAFAILDISPIRFRNPLLLLILGISLICIC